MAQTAGASDVATEPISAAYIENVCEVMGKIEESPEAMSEISTFIASIIGLAEQGGSIQAGSVQGQQVTNNKQPQNGAAPRDTAGGSNPGLANVLFGKPNHPPQVAGPAGPPEIGRIDIVRDSTIYKQNAQSKLDVINAANKKLAAKINSDPALAAKIDAMPAMQGPPALLPDTAPAAGGGGTPAAAGAPLETIPSNGPAISGANRKQQPLSATNINQAALFGGAAGAGLGFAFALAGLALPDSGTRTKKEKVEDVVFATGLGGAGGALGGALDAAWVAPIVARSGFTSAAVGGMAAAGAVAGAATLTISVLWDVRKRKDGKITAVEQRKNFAATGAGTLVGTSAAVSAGAGLMALSTPIGWAIAAGMGAGLLGGIAGSWLGTTIDWLIWDESEDEIAHASEFFDFKYSRGMKPAKHSGKKVATHFARKVDSKKDKNGKFPEKWVLLCNHELMILLRSMYPAFKRLIEEADKLKRQSETCPEGLRAALSSLLQ